MRRDIYPTKWRLATRVTEKWLLTALRLTDCSFKFVCNNRCCRLHSEYRFHNDFVLKRRKINGRQGFRITATRMLSSKGNLTKIFYPFPDVILLFKLQQSAFELKKVSSSLRCCWVVLVGKWWTKFDNYNRQRLRVKKY